MTESRNGPWYRDSFTDSISTEELSKNLENLGFLFDFETFLGSTAADFLIDPDLPLSEMDHRLDKFLTSAEGGATPREWSNMISLRLRTRFVNFLPPG